MTRHGGFLLADGTGVGKTRQQLAVAKHFLDQGKKVVIVSPAEVIKPNWGKGTMSGSWAADSAAMGVPVRLGKGDAAPTPGAARVTTYNELAKLKNHVDKDTVVIWDEAHSLKNAASARAKHAKEINDAAGGALFATATPGDKPLHVAYLAKAGVFGTAGKAKTYEKLGMELHDQHVGGGRYQKVWRVDPRVGYQEAARRIGGLFDQMTRDGLMVKRELSMDGVEMGTDHVPLTPDQHAEVDRVYKDALARTGGNKAVALMAARLHQEPMKIPHAVSAVREELAAGRSPVVFLGRVNDIGEDADDADDADADAAGGRAASEGTARALKAALVAAGVPEADIGELHGGATKTPEQKKRAMDDFQANRKKVMIATVASGGTGINLDDTTGTRPRTVVMMTPPFTANDMAQAVGRVHRLNTKSAAKVRGVLSDTNIDHWNAALLARKFQTLGAFARGETGRARDAVRPEGAPDAGGDEKPYEWGESLLDTRHYADTPFAHNDVVGRFGGQRVNRGTRDAPQWTTAFPSRERYEAYRQHVAATPPAAGAAAGGVASRLVQTSQGPRHVHSFTPGKAYWDRVHKIRPDYVSIRKDERTGQWQGSVWGRTPEEVARNVADLKRRGGY